MKKLIIFIVCMLMAGSCFGSETIAFGKGKIPANYKHIPIMGKPEIPLPGALTYLQKVTKGKTRLNCSLKELAEFYYDEAGRAGIRADLALCQAILETGAFKFFGDVHFCQNNFCGLGTVGGGAKGVRFETPRDGVRAHIQHLQAYCSPIRPKEEIVDPRYDLVHRIRRSKGLITYWKGLSGTWAADKHYCEKIMCHYYAMKNLK